MRQRFKCSWWVSLSLFACVALACSACSGGSGGTGGAGGGETNYEGDEAGECEDNADNDIDGLFDCADPGCMGAPICAGGSTPTPDADVVSDGGTPDVDTGVGASAQAILDLLNERGCATGGCHDNEKATGGLDVTTLDGLFAEASHGPSVIPCEPEASPLYTKVIDPPSFGFLMPIGGDPLSSEDTAMIYDWIAQGAGVVESCEVELPDVGPMDVPTGPDDAEQTGFPDVGPIGPEDAFQPVVPGDGPQVHVSTDGADAPDCGDESAPCATIAAGMAVVADSGGTVLVGAGTYNESELLVPAGVWLVSADGPLAASIYSNDKSAVRFWEVDDAGMDGFHVHGDWNDGAPGDALIRIYDSNGITVRNGVFHDAPSDQDIIKVTGELEGLTLENLILMNPGKPAGSAQFQQLIEIYGSKASSGDVPSIRDVTIRGCWLLQSHEVGGDDMVFLRASVAEVLIENNVFGPSAGPGGASRPAVHIGTYIGPQPDQNYPEARDVVVRNNVFAGLRGDAALGVSNSHRVWVYSNVFFDNTGSATRSVIAIRGNVIPVDELTVVDNIFKANHPEKSGGDLYWVREGGEPVTFTREYNLFHDNVLTSDVDYFAEESSLTGDETTDPVDGVCPPDSEEVDVDGETKCTVDVDPKLDNPLTPPNWSVPDTLDVLHSLHGGFLLGETSPAINAGVDAVGMDGHPAWSNDSIRRWDVLGEPRPLAGQWDIGIHEPMP